MRMINAFNTYQEDLFFSSGKSGWKKFEKNKLTVALNALYVKKDEHILCLHFETKLKSSTTNHSFNESKGRRIALSFSKKLSELLRRITSKNCADFYCLNCFHSSKQKT